MTKFNSLKVFIIIVLGCVICGCVTSANQSEQSVEYVWPPPPEIPRIKWLRNWYHLYDFGTPNRLTTLLLGDQPAVQLRRPSNVVADSKGNVFVADPEEHAVFVFNQEKHNLTFIGEGTLTTPIGLAIDNKRDILFVSDTKLDKVFAFEKNSGRELMVIGGVDELKNPSGLVYDEKRNRLYVSDTKNHIIRVFDDKGKAMFTIGKKGREEGEFYFPSFLALDNGGNLYVVDTFNFRVQIFDPNGTFLRKFGKLGDASGSFSRPAGIGVDSEGHVYVVDTSFNNFQIFDPNGKLLLWVGESGRRPGMFSLPVGMFIDAQDKIYVADTFNHRVQVFQYLREQKTQ